ncbi:MAG: acetoacetyl-CoA reductase [Alphaproteobacteria bacterium]|nr:acetoacetyl-CoA reductase [Alphaproteobacteria bacterium]
MAKLALVTGGTRGIGAAICKALKAAGYDVAANYVVYDEAAQKFEKETGIKIYKWDVSDPDQCVKGVEEVCKAFGTTIDILVNNAGITKDMMMHKMPLESWKAVIEVDLSSNFYMSRAVIGPMRDKSFGRIVNISSINGRMGQMGQTNYSSAKAGVMGFTKALAQESAFKGVTVNAIAPGYVDTDMVKAVPENIMKTIIAKIPVGRLGQPEEIARTVVFLVADDAGFITGETINVNGGQLMD